MKKIFLLIFATSLCVISCDKIGDGERLKNDYGFIELPDSTNKVVLLEEFTGVRCVNCPVAAAKAHDYEQAQPGKVVIVSIHAGFFATPDSDHPNDFRTEDGTTLFNFFTPPGAPVPSGMFDRAEYPSDEHVKNLSDWDASFADRLGKTSNFEITSDFKFDISSENFNLKVNVRALQGLEDQNIYLSAFLLESGIVGPQIQPDGKTKEDYVHNHVLRATFNGAFGEEIIKGSVNDNQVISKSFTLPKKSEWVTENCAAVIFIYDRATYEVLQAHHADL